MKKLFIAFVLSIFLTVLSLFARTSIFAANTTMGFVPSSGTYDKPFAVSLVIDGNGDKFNAAQATVNLSDNLVIQDLTFGDCNFSFLKTPSIQNPSFEGVLMGTNSTKCTVYILTLAPTTKGKNGSLSLSKATVKRYGDAAEVLSSTKNGSYVLTAVIQSSSALGTQLKNTSQDGLYTLYLKVFAANHTPVPHATVILTQIATKDQEQAITDSTGVAHFSNLKQGLYDAVVNEGRNKVGEIVINVTGANHVLAVGINLAFQKTNPLLKTNSLINTITTNPLIPVGILIPGIILGIVIAILVFKLIGKKG